MTTPTNLTEMAKAIPKAHNEWRLRSAILANGEFGGYVEIVVRCVHRYGCPITRNGKKYGLCDCGAHAEWDKLGLDGHNAEED